MANDDDEVRIEGVKALRATERAFLVRIEGEEHWFPQSQICDDSEVYKAGDEGTLVITRWIAQQKGLL